VALAEEIKKALMENPSILIEVLISRPEIIYQALAKLTPWQILATRDDIKKIEERLENIERSMVTKDEAKNFATKDDIKNLVTKDEAKNFATKDDIKNLVTKDEAKNFATKDDLRALEKRLVNLITGLGARWGLMAEESFREGVKEILKDTGFSATKDLLYDKDGKIYGEPSDVEYDLIVKDGKAIMIEITSALKRGDLSIIKKKKEFYELQRSVKIEKIIIITPFIHDKYPDRVRAMANSMNIDIVYPIP
jgi:Uncharacterized conserved protein containing a coiled-coil domain